MWLLKSVHYKMKCYFHIFLTILLSLILSSNTNTQIKDCRCKNIELKGRVKIVNNFADFKVKVVNSFADLRVKKVKSFPNNCGEWQFVESGEDFTIQFVNEFPNFTIMYVEQFPGTK